MTSSLAAQKIILCGGEEVSVWEFQHNQCPCKIWSWRAKNCPGATPEIAARFRTTDECKLVASGTALLITSSGGGLAWVDFPSGQTTFFAEEPNAHSAELFSGLVVCACSYVSSLDSLRGNCLSFYDVSQPQTPLYRHRLVFAHGVVWDRARQILWALGYEQLYSFSVERTLGGVQIKQLACYELPSPEGHDLRLWDDRVLLSTAEDVLVFDPSRENFSPYLPLASRKQIKSLDVHPSTGQIVYVAAQAPHWWSDTISFLKPEGRNRFEGACLYKARWLTSSL